MYSLFAPCLSFLSIEIVDSTYSRTTKSFISACINLQEFISSGCYILAIFHSSGKHVLERSQLRKDIW